MGEADGNLSAMLQTVESLSGEWSGLAQVDYAARFNDEVPRMQSTLRELLEELIRELRRIADVFEETDRSVV
jgi:WXG100 family type VII secretion target